MSRTFHIENIGSVAQLKICFAGPGWFVDPGSKAGYLSASLMNRESNEMTTLPEVAAYLRVSRSTILRMLKRMELWGVKVGKEWRFSEPIVEEWLKKK